MSDKKQINITLGTAGHIDHGKTALIRNLTGCETDRLKVEKERGMSIELGFAPCTIADLEVGIVDVPGHENFIKTMVAGAGSIDGVIFVVAADDGVMPQTREHMEILTLLGVKHGIVALTKVDRIADEQGIELVTAQVRDYLYGTFLQDAPILPMSNITGAGFGEFYDELKDMVAAIEPKRTDGVYRMPVEKSFSVKGFGTIVSGIAITGSAKVGDEVTLLPANVKGRIKTIQVYSKLADKVQAGQCAAVGIPQLDHKLISRGSTIAMPGYFGANSWFLGNLRLLSHDKLSLKNGSRVKLHTGTTEVIATVYFTSSDMLTAGENDIVQIRTKEAIVAGPADRFIIRSMSPVSTIGGGTIIEAIPKRLKRTDPAVIADVKARAIAVENELAYVEYYASKAVGAVNDIAIIAKQTKMPLARAEQLIKQAVSNGTIIELVPGQYMHKDVITKIQQETAAIIEAYHKSNPQSPGLGADNIHQDFALAKKVFDAIANLSNEIELNNNRLVIKGFKTAVSDGQQELLDKVEKLFKLEQFKPPKPADIAQLSNLNAADANKALHLLKDNGLLIEIERGMFFHTDAIEAARGMIIDYIKAEGGLESVQFKYLLQTTRKFAIPLLDYFDNIGLTRRDGYTRLLRGRH